MEYYKVEVENIKDTDRFRPAALHFEKYGYYTAAPKGTTAYYEFWNEQEKRCLDGYSVDGYFITGYFYFYLNYTQILKNVYNEVTGKLDRVKGFPSYYDYDKEYFDAVEAAERSGKHLAVIKKRGSGYSWKGGSMLCRNYFLIPGSKSYAIASEKEFLVKDGLLSKAWEIMSFIDDNTAWFKKRQKTDTIMHKRASIVVNQDGVNVEIGFQSEIIGVSLSNDPHRARGKRGKLILWEEGGVFPNLRVAWQIARPSVEDTDHRAFGLQILYGTGGGDDADYIGLKDIFYEPEAYNCLPVENIWDEGATQPCGFFVPQYYNMGRFMDEDGNSNVREAIDFELIQREKILKTATDRSLIDRYVAEQPFTPAEACLAISTNIFPKAELIKHLAYIKSNKAIRGLKQSGRLVYDDAGVLQWVLSEYPKDLTSYRVPKGVDLAGEIVIWEHPMDNPPWGMYFAACDSYDFDQSGTNSLGSVFIYKRFTSFELTYDVIVAEYTGRPQKAEQFYENVLKLLQYYNAKMLYENQNPGILVYFRNKHVDYYLADQPDILNKIVKDSRVSRGKGIHMTKEIKAFGEGRWKDWLITKRSDGKLNLHTLLSEPLIEELIAYNDKGNFDRCSAIFILAIYLEELHNITITNREEESKTNLLFPDGLFIENSYFKLDYGI